MIKYCKDQSTSYYESVLIQTIFELANRPMATDGTVFGPCHIEAGCYDFNGKPTYRDVSDKFIIKFDYSINGKSFHVEMKTDVGSNDLPYGSSNGLDGLAIFDSDKQDKQQVQQPVAHDPAVLFWSEVLHRDLRAYEKLDSVQFPIVTLHRYASPCTIM